MPQSYKRKRNNGEAHRGPRAPFRAMKVSIVIPAYNEQKSIASALRAALALEYPSFEIIVVDNASTDRTAEIAREFPVNVVREERKGILFARERGRREASGEIIANMDADCLPEKEWLSRGVKWFEDDPRVCAVSGPYDYYDAGPSFRIFSLLSQKYLYAFMNFMVRSLRKGGVIIGGNTLIRASALEAAGGYDTSIPFYGEDTDTMKRIYKQGKIIFDPRFTIKTSARRFKSEGTLRIAGRYLFYFFKTIFSREKREN